MSNPRLERGLHDVCTGGPELIFVSIRVPAPIQLARRLVRREQPHREPIQSAGSRSREGVLHRDLTIDASPSIQSPEGVCDQQIRAARAV